MNDRQLVKLMRDHGIVFPRITLQEARRAGIELAVACGVLEQESSGGHNVFGHDPTIFAGAGEVTRQKYLAYKRLRDDYRRRGLNRFQGVGPTQLTWYSYQDRADALGGCYRPDANMRVGFSLLRALIRSKGLFDGLTAYNGSSAYPRQVIPRIQQWRHILGGAVRPAPRPALRSLPRPPAHHDGGRPVPRGPYASEFVRICLAVRGDRYVFGAKGKFSDPHPQAFDCSGLVTWAAHRAGGSMPDGSVQQEDFCRAHRTMITIQQAARIQGALVFRHRGADQHVVVSLGNGSTMEARGRAYGVNVFSLTGRVWTAAALLPGFTYKRPPDIRRPPWPGRFITQPPPMRGMDVQRWQHRMRQRGWRLPVNGVYEARSEEVCRAFQHEKGLVVDGVIGPDTWYAAWNGPVT
jgi:hypothetical protein